MTLLHSFLVQPNSFAQDARLSQVWQFPSMLNPSMVGAGQDQLKAGSGLATHSNKLSSVHHQYVYTDGRVNPFRKKNGDAIGLGASLYHYGHAAGPKSAPLSARFLSLSAAYHHPLDKLSRQVLGIGVQVAFAKGNLLSNGSAFNKELAGGGFSPESGRLPKSYMDFNFGGYYRLNANKVIFETGAGIYHFTHPQNMAVPTSADLGVKGRVTIHNKVMMRVMPERILSLSHVFWVEGLHSKNSSLEFYSILSNWTGAELVSSVTGRKFVFDYGLFTRSMRTLMPVLKVHHELGISASLSHERLLAGAKDYPTYAQGRTELAIQYSIREISMPKLHLEQIRLPRLNWQKKPKVQEVVKANVQTEVIQPQSKVETMETVKTIQRFTTPDQYYMEQSLQMDPKDSMQYFVFFDFQRGIIAERSFVVLSRLLDFLKTHPEYSIKVSGHAYKEGIPADDAMFSLRRAEAVRSYFTSYGVEGKRFSISYHADSQALQLIDRNLHWMNRRVEILLIRGSK